MGRDERVHNQERKCTEGSGKEGCPQGAFQGIQAHGTMPERERWRETQNCLNGSAIWDSHVGKTVWQYLLELNIHKHSNPAILFIGMFQREMHPSVH